MNISAGSNLTVGEVKSRITGKVKPVIIVRAYRDKTTDVGVVTLTDGTKILTGHIIYKATGLQINVETETTIYMDQETWERYNA